MPRPNSVVTHTQHLSESCEPLRKCLRRGQRVISQKAEDGRNVPDCGGGFVAFPIVNGRGVNADLLSNLGLEEAEVQTTVADVLA